MEELLAHPAIRKIAEATRGTPFESQLYLVGGAVRDALLGRPLKNDFDLVTELDSGRFARLMEERGVAIGGVELYPRFGTAMIRVEESQIELVTARRESYTAGSRKPQVEPATLAEDARRRDFTCNALMLGIHSGEMLDLLGTGLDDLRMQTLRTPQDPVETFRDDPLRMLRAVRFRQSLGFEYAPGLADAIEQESSSLHNISLERIRDEFTKMLLGPRPSGALEDLRRFGLLRGWADELLSLVGVTQGSYHYTDVWTHTLHVLENARSDSIELALAALLHDIGKPLTRTIDEHGDIRFFGHENVGAELALKLCRRWRYSQRTAESVARMVKNHMRLNSMKSVSSSAARRIVRDLGEDLEDWMRLVQADAGALKVGVKTLDLGPLREKIREVMRETPRRTWESPLSGDEIMEIMLIPPGPEVGHIKARLAELVIDGELAPDDRDGARELVGEWSRNQSSETSVNEPNSSGKDHS